MEHGVATWCWCWRRSSARKLPVGVLWQLPSGDSASTGSGEWGAC